MKVGDICECAIWLSGTESERHVGLWKADSRNLLAAQAPDLTITFGPIMWTIKRPGEYRVPPVPKHINGPDVRLLLAEAEVKHIRERLKATSFLADLEPRDLERLRAITRQVRHRAKLSDQECDAIIEAIGPKAAESVVRRAALH